MIVIGVTGGTGCGKTAFLQRIAARGGEVIDCDALYAALVRKDAALRVDLDGAFGGVFLPDGTLDRKKLAQIVFSDEAQLEILNQIVYRHMFRAVSELLTQSTAELFAIDAINLLQSGLGDLCQVTVAITAPEEVRLRRIMQRDGIDEAAARLRIRAQEENDFFIQRCDHHLDNGGDDWVRFAEEADGLLERIVGENGGCAKQVR